MLLNNEKKQLFAQCKRFAKRLIHVLHVSIKFCVDNALYSVCTRLVLLIVTKLLVTNNEKQEYYTKIYNNEFLNEKKEILFKFLFCLPSTARLTYTLMYKIIHYIVKSDSWCFNQCIYFLYTLLVNTNVCILTK